MSQKPETVFRKKVVKALKTLPFIEIFSIQQKTILGDPDLLICLCGLFIALELKSELGDASILQQHKLGRVRKAKGLAFTVFPNNWESVFLTLKRISTGDITDDTDH